MKEGIVEASFYAVLGSQIEAKRRQRGLSQIEVAKLLGVHRNTICRWESGDSPIDAWQLLRLADALSCNHLLLMPPRRFTWGEDLLPVQRERDPKVRVA